MFKKLTLFLYLFTWTLHTHAAPVNLDFEAQVYAIDDPHNVLFDVLGLSVGLGDTVMAGYSMESNPPYVDDGPISIGAASYTVQTTINSFADFGDVQLNASDTRVPGSVLVGDDVFTSGVTVDTWRVFVDLIPPGGEQPNIWMGVVFNDETTSQLTNDNFYVNDSFVGWSEAIFFIRDEQNLLLRARYDIPSVPIPAAIWLFGSGFLGLVGIARRKKS